MARRWGGALKALLAPVEPGEFLQRYWGRRALHLTGRRDRFKSLFDKARFWRALKRIDAQGAQSRALIRAHWGTQEPDDGSEGPFTRVDAKGARAALARGASLCVNVISDGDPKLARFARTLQRQLGHPGLVRFNAYYSPHEGGLPVHFDARVAWVLQLHGRKRWWYTRAPAVDWPRSNADRLESGEALYVDAWAGAERWERARPTAAADFESVLLEPGDSLVLPAGAWHAAGANRESLALTLCFDPVSPLQLLTDALDQQLRGEAEWRSCPPLPNGSAYLAQRARQLSRALARLATQPKRLERIWTTLQRG